jgi:spermidine/putrescine transport system ATP-binding protein
VIRFDLRAGDGSPMVAHVGPEDDLPLLRPGERVWATWEPEAGRLLRRTDRVVPDATEAEIESLKSPTTGSLR